MGKFFGAILVLLVVVIGAEVYFLATAPAVKRSLPKAVQPPLTISPSPFPTASPEILAEIKRWRSRLPTKASSFQTKKYGRVFNVQATLVSQEDKKVRARAENNKDLNFALNGDTQFFSRRGKEGKNLLQTLEPAPFSLKKGQVYLFEWQAEKNNNSSSIISLWRISRFLD